MNKHEMKRSQLALQNGEPLQETGESTAHLDVHFRYVSVARQTKDVALYLLSLVAFIIVVTILALTGATEWIVEVVKMVWPSL
jgi:hypothetical protein